MGNEKSSSTNSEVGLVLSGGGARGAYQAGVLRAIAEIRAANPGTKPIRVVTGVSAGAINAAYVASNCDDELTAARKLTHFWSTITSDRVYRTDPFSIGRIGFKFLTDTMLGSFSKRKQARSLLDTSPLRELLKEHLNLDRIPEHIASGKLHALAVSALNYSTSHSISFVQGREDIAMWDRARRRGEVAKITVDHILASASLPLFFPPVHVGDDYFGDGSLRNTAPLSSAVHLGADRLIVVSVRRPEEKAMHVTTKTEPSIARVLGVMLNALIMDAIEFDMERLSRINTTLSLVPGQSRERFQLRKVDYLWIRPSEDLGFLASGRFDSLPPILRYMMGGLGSSKESSELTSYLLFEPDYCSKLIEIGYRDGMAHADQIVKFLGREDAPAKLEA